MCLCLLVGFAFPQFVVVVSSRVGIVVRFPRGLVVRGVGVLVARVVWQNICCKSDMRVQRKSGDHDCARNLTSSEFCTKIFVVANRHDIQGVHKCQVVEERCIRCEWTDFPVSGRGEGCLTRLGEQSGMLRGMRQG